MKYSILADNLRALREKKGLTQAKMAQYLNIAKQTYSGYENRVSSPDLQTLVEISKILNVTTDSLLGCERQRKEIDEESYLKLIEARNIIDNIIKEKK